MGLSYRASRILQRLHAAIQARGQNGLDGFRARLHEQCLDGKREATERHFVAAVSGSHGVLSAEEAGILFRELGGKDSSVPFAEVLHADDDDIRSRTCDFAQRPQIKNSHTRDRLEMASRLVCNILTRLVEACSVEWDSHAPPNLTSNCSLQLVMRGVCHVSNPSTYQGYHVYGAVYLHGSRGFSS